MDEKKEQFGNANTKNSSYGSVGAFNGLFSQDIANQAMSIANQLYPQLPEPDPWEAAFQFFAEMGRQASQPGATVLGSAVGSMQAPLDYLNAKKKEKAESDRAKMQSTISLGTALKGKDKITYRPATDAELAQYGATAGQMGSDNKFYDLSSSGDSSKPNTQLSKLYDDFDKATSQAEKNATKFLTENPNATVEQISEAAESDPSAQEAKTLSEQIDTVAQAAGFNKEIFSAERDIRKEWNNFKKPFNLIQIGYQKLKASLESGTGAGDMAAVFGFMKLLDPNSVVRESEFSAAQNTAGLMDKIYLQKETLKKGDLLTPPQRDEFLKLATQFYNLTKDQFADARLDLGQVVENNPVFNVENIFGSEPAPPSWYTSQEVYNSAKSVGLTVDEIWEAMTEPERKKWKQEKWSIVMAKDEAPIRSIQEVILDLQKKKSLETDVVDTEIENVNNNKTFLEDAKDFVAPIIDFSKDKFEDFTEDEFVSATTDEVMRQLGLTARATGEGAASLVGVFYDPVATILNLGSKFTGGSLDIQSFSSQVSNILNELGVPEPETETERVVNMIGQGMTAGGGSASLAKGLTNFFTGVSKKVSQIMAANPISQTIAGGSAGGSGQVASEMGYGPIAQLAASLFGGVAGAKVSNVKTTPISQTVKDTVKEATDSGVPVLTSDVRPPNTFAGKWLQTTSETIPVIGTGIIRKGQQDSRAEAVLDLARSYGIVIGDNLDFVSNVTKDLLRKRGSDLKKYSTAKKAVINSEQLNEAGTVDVSRTVSAIDQEIDTLLRLKSAEFAPVIERLKDWKSALVGLKTIKLRSGKTETINEGQNLQNIEMLRKQIGQSFESPDMASARVIGQESLNRIYGPLREDMRSFIEMFGKRNDIKRFDTANARLSELAGDLDNSVFKNIVKKGEITPENLSRMLFSKKPSDVKLIYKSLDQVGKANAKASIIAEMFKKSVNADGSVSPEIFKSQIQKMSNPLGIFFEGKDLDAIEGLSRILTLTRQASQSNVAPKTGSQLQIPLITAFLVDTFGVSSGLITYGSIGAIAQVLESPAVRNILTKLPKVSAGSPQEANLVKRLDDIIMKEFSNEEETGNIEEIDSSLSPALQSLIQTTDPSLLSQIS